MTNQTQSQDYNPRFLMFLSKCNMTIEDYQDSKRAKRISLNADYIGWIGICSSRFQRLHDINGIHDDYQDKFDGYLSEQPVEIRK